MTKTINVQLSSDIKKMKGARRKMHFKFWTLEYVNQFNIIKGGISQSGYEFIENLKKGQKVELAISESDFNILENSSRDITVRGISIGGRVVMTSSEFSQIRNQYILRKSVFFAFIGMMILLNGSFNISSKHNYAIVGFFFTAVLIMKIIGFGIY